MTNYNYSKFIEQAINSILKQSYKNFELLIIDDGSTDNSSDIINKYRFLSNIKIFYQNNKGLNSANNLALKHSRGKYIIRVDADDYLNERAIEILVNEVEKDENISIIFPDYYLVDINGNIIAEEKRHNFDQVTLLDQPAHGACTMIKKELLISLGGYSEEFTRQDGYELWIKAMRNYKVKNINLPLFYYRQHNESLTQDKEILFKTRDKIIKKHLINDKIESKKNIAIIPIRDLGKDTFALRKFANTTLIDIQIKRLINSKYVRKIIVSTPNSFIISHIKKKYGNSILIDKRPKKLAFQKIFIDETLKHVIKKFKLFDSDTYSLINYEYPFRKSFYVDQAINSLYLFDSDSVISVSKENHNYYRHLGGGLVPFHSNKKLRLERDSIFCETGGIHTISGNYFRNFGTIEGKRISHIILDKNSCKFINDEEDFSQYELYYKSLNK